MILPSFGSRCSEHRNVEESVEVITCEYTIPSVHDKTKTINYATVIVLCSIGNADSPQADEIIRTYRSRGYRLNIVYCSKQLFKECFGNLLNVNNDTNAEKAPEK